MAPRVGCQHLPTSNTHSPLQAPPPSSPTRLPTPPFSRVETTAADSPPLLLSAARRPHSPPFFLHVGETDAHTTLILRRHFQAPTPSSRYLGVRIYHVVRNFYPNLSPNTPKASPPSTTGVSTSPDNAPLFPPPPNNKSGPLPVLFPPPNMFQPEHFPLRGSRFHDAVAKLRHGAYTNLKMLAHYSEEARSRRWRDVLGRGQDRAFSYIHTADMWHSSGADEDFRQALSEVPVLALAIVRPFPQDPARYIVVATYNGRAAAFNLPRLEPNSTWFRRCELLPAELRQWLDDDGIFVLTTDATSPLTTDPDGLHPTRCISTNVLFGVYQHAGVIKPHFKADRGDLAWQMVYATGYHHRPSPRPKLLQFVGEDHFRSAWPEWREPGWLPTGTDALNPQEEFFLYYEAAGMQLFISRLLQHGLVYGGMRAVDPTLSLRQLYQVFLEGGETKPWAAGSDPLGIKSDFPPPQYFHNIPALLQYVPEEFRPTASPTAAGGASGAEEGGAAALEEEKQQEQAAEEGSEDKTSEEDQLTVVPAGDALQEFPPTPPKRSRPSEDGSNNNDGENEVELILNDQALEKEFLQEDDNNNDKHQEENTTTITPTATQKRLLELAQTLQPPPLSPEQAAAAVAAESAPMEVDPSPRVPPPPKAPPTPLFSIDHPGPNHLTGANTAPIGSLATAGPLPGRLGPPVRRPPPPTAPPKSGRRVFLPGQELEPVASPAAADEPKHEPPSPRYGPQDVRARLFPALADAEAFKEEAPAAAVGARAPVAVCRRDLNIRFSTQVKMGANVARFRRQNSALPFAPLPEQVEIAAPTPIDETRLSNARLTHDERLRNPYLAAPIFDNKCDFCSAKHCSRFVAGTTLPNCQKYREQVLFAPTRRICDYRRCLAPHEHHTVTCPYLHKKCSKCGCRGHDTVDGCDLRNADVMARLRSDFEEYASCGIFTRKRFDAIEWGFYPIPSFRPPSNFVSYRRLTDLPVLEAMAFLQSLLLLPENVAASREHAPQPPPSPAPASVGDATTGNQPTPSNYSL